MKRRRFVQALATLPAAPALLAQQPVVPPKPTPRAIEEVPRIEATIPDIAAEPVPGFFKADEMAALRNLSDILMPAINGTPGAVDARAAEFLDFLIGQSPADRQHVYRAGLGALNGQSKKRFGKPFGEVKSPQADELLASLHQPVNYLPATDPLKEFLITAKADVMTATINSREWISVVSKRSRSAGGVGMYWYAIE